MRRTAAFSIPEKVRPMIETVPLEQATEAYARMISGNAASGIVVLTGAAAGNKMPGPEV